ncbi:MAG: hypothetical protein ACR2JJ_11965 [Sphingomicrobium sp.]
MQNARWTSSRHYDTFVVGEAREIASEIIKGRVEPTKPDRVKWGYAYYKRLQIHLDGGGIRELAKVSAAGAIRDLIERGGEGEFHLSTHARSLGIHGVRTADGSKHYARFSNIEVIMAIGGIIAIVGFILRAGDIVTDFPLTPIVIGAVLGIFYFIVRAGRIANKNAFDAA